jgi:hypothetical protein
MNSYRKCGSSAVGFVADSYRAGGDVHIRPVRVHHFLLSHAGHQKEFKPQPLFVVAGFEQIIQFCLLVHLRLFLRITRPIVLADQSTNPIRLVQGAQQILGPFGVDCDLRRWGLKLAERGGRNGKKRAIVATARKLAVLLHHLWVSGEVYEPFAQPQPNDSSRSRVKTKPFLGREKTKAKAEFR